MNKTFLLCKPWPRDPEAETAIQPLIWCSESLSVNMYYSQEECITTLVSLVICHRCLTGYLSLTGITTRARTKVVLVKVVSWIISYFQIRFYICVMNLMVCIQTIDYSCTWYTIQETTFTRTTFVLRQTTLAIFHRCWYHHTVLVSATSLAAEERAPPEVRIRL